MTTPADAAWDAEIDARMAGGRHALPMEDWQKNATDSRLARRIFKERTAARGLWELRSKLSADAYLPRHAHPYSDAADPTYTPRHALRKHRADVAVDEGRWAA